MDQDDELIKIELPRSQWDLLCGLLYEAMWTERSSEQEDLLCEIATAIEDGSEALMQTEE